MCGAHHMLKWILFESERLAEWAQLLDFAARMSPNSSETRAWFSRFTHGSGVDDAKSVVEKRIDADRWLEIRRAPLHGEHQPRPVRDGRFRQ